MNDPIKVVLIFLKIFLYLKYSKVLSFFLFLNRKEISDTVQKLDEG